MGYCHSSILGFPQLLKSPVAFRSLVDLLRIRSLNVPGLSLGWLDHLGASAEKLSPSSPVKIGAGIQPQPFLIQVALKMAFSSCLEQLGQLIARLSFGGPYGICSSCAFILLASFFHSVLPGRQCVGLKTISLPLFV